jgi:ribosome-binding factor A
MGFLAMTRRRSRGRVATHDSTDPDFFFGDSRRKQNRRKDFQLCGQVRQAIAAALAAELEDPLLSELWVVQVEPAPSVSQLRVWVALAEGSPFAGSPELILARLARVEGVLRGEVAAAIHRKRVPTLSYAVWLPEVG